MAKPHACADLEQPRLCGGLGRVAIDARGRGGPPQQRRVADGVGGRQQHQPPRGAGELGDPLSVGVLDLVRHARGVGQHEPARELPRGEAPGQLEQGQRIASRLGNDPVAHARVKRTRHHRFEQRPGLGVGQSLQPHLGQARQVAHPQAAGVAHGEDDRYALGKQAARDEPQDLTGGAVEPLRIVDQAQQRSFLGDLGHQAQHGQGHEEVVGRITGSQAQRDPQGGLLGLGQRGVIGQHRRAELVQPCERQLHLSLNA